jgi:hypothetical protein
MEMNRTDGKSMIWTLIRQDNAISQPYMAIILPFFLAMMLLLLEGAGLDVIAMPMSDLHPPVTLLYMLAWLFFLFILLATNITQRSSRMSLILPLPARRLWLTRIVSIFSVAILPVAIVTLILSLRFSDDGSISMNPGIWLLGAHTASSLIAVGMFLQAPTTALYRIKGSPGYITFAAFVSFIMLVITIAGLRFSYSLLFFLAAALVTGALIYRSLPSGFMLAGREPEPAPIPAEMPQSNRLVWHADGGGDESAAIQENGYRGLLHMTIFRVLVNRWNVWIYMLMVVGYSFSTTIAYYESQRDNPFFFFMFLWIWLAVYNAAIGVKRIDFLPISRKLLFAYAMVPSLVCIALGFGIGKITVASNPVKYMMIRFYDHTIHYPDEFLEITKGGKAPLLMSPWGETFQARSYPLYRGSDIVVYKPFDCGRESSARFAMYQVDRAIEAVHGIPRDPHKVYEGTDDPSEKLVQCCYSPKTTASAGSQTRNRAFGVGAIVFALFYIFVILMQVKSIRVGKPKGWRPYTVITAFALVMGSVVAVYLLGRTGFIENTRAAAAMPSILMRKIAEAIPLGVSALWALFGLICVAGYLLLQSAFEKIESPPDTTKQFMEEY